MAIFSETEVRRLKLESLGSKYLRQLLEINNLESKGSVNELIKSGIGISASSLDSFIKREYQKRIAEREKIVPTAFIKSELEKVKEFSWGTIQGGLDQKIQRDLIQTFTPYNQLLARINSHLYPEVTQYVIAKWFNWWTTAIIQEIVSQHSKVVPVLKENYRYDLFFDSQPFDLKVTRLPDKFLSQLHSLDLKRLATWMYEKQGPERFSDTNRFFIIMVDQRNPDESWKIKRDFDLIRDKVYAFLDSERVTKNDEIIFSYRKRGTLSTVAKVLIIKK